VYSDEKVSETAVQIEVIPTTPEVKENVALALARAAKNGKLLFPTYFIGHYAVIIQ